MTDIEMDYEKRLKYLVEKHARELEELEARYGDLVSNVPVCVIQANLAGDILFINDKALMTLGLKSKEEAASCNMGSMYKNPEVRKKMIRKLKELEKIENHEVVLVTKTGKNVNLMLNATLHDDVISTMAVDITEQKATFEALVESENMFRDLAEKAFVGIYLVQNEMFEYVNIRYAGIFGYKVKELAGKKGIKDVAHPDDWPLIQKTINKWKASKSTFMHNEFRGITKNGKIIAVEVFASRTIYNGRPADIGTLIDITERKLAHDALKEREEDLAIKSKTLEELNITLRVLLQQMETEKKALEEKFAFNVKQFVLPYVEKIQRRKLDNQQRAFIDIIEANLKHMISPFLDAVRQFNLTPKEMEVASFIRDKKSTKEIADILCVSPAAVDAHRNRIRKKFGLNNKKANLQVFLQGLK